MSKQIKTFGQLKDSRLLYEEKLPTFAYFLLLTVTTLIIFVILWSIKTPKIYMIKAGGIIQSTNKNYVMPAYSGEIMNIHIQEGLQVEKGDLLLTVKSTDLDLQGEQLKGQKEIHEKQMAQLKKLIKSIEENKNHFSNNEADKLYYNQYEAYQSQIAQQELDLSTYKNYGYTDEQIAGEIVKNESKIAEIYHTTLKGIEDSILQSQNELDVINVQLSTVDKGQESYQVRANATGKVHMMADYKEGMIVQAGSAVASIASENDEYIVQANISAGDAARVSVGDKVDIVVSGLIQTVYGTITGEVAKIDSDITIDSENKESYFKAEIVPDSTYLVSKEGNKVNISNGMAVETRIQYDQVTYFNYVLESLGVLTR
ncbi:HlyD family secretion protein [Alkalibaculum bacchi]|uniref:HlyD family secretion protein n=1 Tax=Alkalibaculum bacchi TaxID=645887 RepID=UPI0026F0E7DE|nr:HlyD family efflux transporter periplasmic adaptor subunit [Alkalibaculum bacchi]